MIKLQKFGEGDEKKETMKRLILLAAAFLIISGPAQAQLLQTLSGLTLSVDASSRKLHVLFEHPVTGEETVKVFEILPGTNFKNVKRLEQIQPNDPVNVDYEEDGAGELKAVYIEVVSLDKVPFTKEQLKAKLGFIS